ncbi:MAG TPA: histidinol dehydrogenase [Cyclobacteriaceae bacterium]
MQIVRNPSEKDWLSLCQRPQEELEYLESGVRNILARVKNSGDRALQELTLQFDKATLTDLQVSDAEINNAEKALSDKLKSAIRLAAQNIRTFHASQKRDVSKIETTSGVTCWRKSVGIQKIGIYIPGGSAPLFSTVLMLGLPAQLAQCKEIVMCTPPDQSGQINPAILFAAKLTGIRKIFKVGGAQAIAAMAYGTESIPRVQKIFGPGNQFVTKAKQMVANEGVAIDLPAGPSEVLVLADDSADASFVAADLLSQAEHGPDSQVMLVVTTESIIYKIQDEIKKQLISLPRKEIAEQALKNSCAIYFDSFNSAIAFIDEYAPEHLIINTVNADELAEKISHAGSVFIGNYSPEAAGDYASGTNHTLPTNGFAKLYGGVSLESFTKHITFQKITSEGIKNLGPVIEEMAEAENLIAHKRAVSIRLNQLKK